jgi:hypothetical protein
MIGHLLAHNPLSNNYGGIGNRGNNSTKDQKAELA